MEDKIKYVEQTEVAKLEKADTVSNSPEVTPAPIVTVIETKRPINKPFIIGIGVFLIAIVAIAVALIVSNNANKANTNAINNGVIKNIDPSSIISTKPNPVTSTTTSTTTTTTTTTDPIVIDEPIIKQDLYAWHYTASSNGEPTDDSEDADRTCKVYASKSGVEREILSMKPCYSLEFVEVQNGKVYYGTKVDSGSNIEIKAYDWTSNRSTLVGTINNGTYSNANNNLNLINFISDDQFIFLSQITRDQAEEGEFTSENAEWRDVLMFYNKGLITEIERLDYSVGGRGTGMGDSYNLEISPDRSKFYFIDTYTMFQQQDEELIYQDRIYVYDIKHSEGTDNITFHIEKLFNNATHPFWKSSNELIYSYLDGTNNWCSYNFATDAGTLLVSDTEDMYNKLISISYNASANSILYTVLNDATVMDTYKLNLDTKQMIKLMDGASSQWLTDSTLLINRYRTCTEEEISEGNENGDCVFNYIDIGKGIYSYPSMTMKETVSNPGPDVYIYYETAFPGDAAGWPID